MTEREAAQLVAFLSAAYPRTAVSAETVAVYCTGLADLRFERGREACASLVRSSKWLPTVAEIRTEAQLLAQQDAARRQAEAADRGLAEPAPYPPEEQARINRQAIARIKRMLDGLGKPIDIATEET